MLFTHDTEMSLSAAAALVNTGLQAEEELPDEAALDAFAKQWRWTGAPVQHGDLEAVRSLRPRLARLWQVDEDTAVDIVNGMLAEAQALPQLVRHDEFDYHLHAIPREAPLEQRMKVDIAMAFVDVIRAKELDRLGVCAASACEDVLVDLSRNRSRRFCGVACTNRMNVAAYRARARSADPA
jgi:predicted RNA-binding Zn ribbon-like protein